MDVSQWVWNTQLRTLSFSCSERGRLRRDLHSSLQLPAAGKLSVRFWALLPCSQCQDTWPRAVLVRRSSNSELVEGAGHPQSCPSLSMGSGMFWEGGMYFLIGVRAVDHLEMIWPPEQICRKQMWCVVFEIILFSSSFSGFLQDGKIPTSDASEAQRSNPESDAGCAPQLNGFKFTHGLFFSFYLFLEMPELFLMGKHARAQYPENTNTPSEGKSTPVLCLQSSQSRSKGETWAGPGGAHRPQWLGLTCPGTPSPTTSCQGPRDESLLSLAPSVPA